MSSSPATEQSCLAYQAPDDGVIDDWIQRFHRDGCLFLRNVLPPGWCAELRRDLESALSSPEASGEKRPRKQLHPRMFETSAANLRLFDLEPIVTFAERLVAPDCHVIHNNSFRTPPAGASAAGTRTTPPTSR